MSKKLTLAALIAIALLGSLFTILGSNMFFSDIANMSTVGPKGFISTFPALMFAALFPTAVLYVLRYHLRPKTFKRMTRLYVIIAMSLSFVGFICSILSGVIVYGSFVKPYPFPGYLIIFMILHLLVLGGGVYALIRLHKMPEDEEKFKVGAKHVFSTLGWFLFICLVLNRLGMFIAMPLYVHWRTFYMTFPFYMFLLVPAYLGAVKVLFLLDVIPSAKQRIILSCCGLGCAVVLFTIIAVIGLNNTAFVSNVSTCMPLERLASKPVEIAIHIASVVAVGVILLVQSIKKLKAN